MFNDRLRDRKEHRIGYMHAQDRTDRNDTKGIEGVHKTSYSELAAAVSTGFYCLYGSSGHQFTPLASYPPG